MAIEGAAALAALDQPTSREVAAHILHGAAALHTRCPDRPGCLGVQGAVAGTDDSQPVRRALVDARAQGEASLRVRLERERKEGDLPRSANCAALAAFVCAVGHGMAIQARAGFSREVLESVADQALATWPTRNGPPAAKPGTKRARPATDKKARPAVARRA